jgi:nucleoside-diphosphate-sugar epimerase
MPFPKLLITGCNGLIGGILWENLVDTFQLYGVDLSMSENRINVFQGDISDLEQVQGIFNSIPGLTYVVHLAGDARVEADWESVYKSNIAGTRNIYETAHTSGVKRIVFASSNHVTGGFEGIPPRLHEQSDPPMITTQDPIRPDSYYGVSKAAGEALARMYFELYGLESVCLRIGSCTRDDDPTQNSRYMSTWLSHKDLIQLVRKSLLSDVKFGIYYGVSNNRRRFWDTSNASTELGYHPADDASSFPMNRV